MFTPRPSSLELHPFWSVRELSREAGANSFLQEARVLEWTSVDLAKTFSELYRGLRVF